jgi:hypothetical protein
MITYQELKNASQLFESIGEIRNYITKERFELAAKCEFNITNEKSIERMFGLFCEVPNIMYRIACHDEEIKDELTTALHIAQTAYENVEINNAMLPKLEEGYLYEKDKRRYFYRIGEDGAIQELDVNLNTPFGIITFSDLLKRPDVKITGVTHYRGKIERNQSKVEYYEGDIAFVWDDPTDRIFFSWYSSDAGVYLSTDGGWKKLLYTPGRGYLDKNKEPDFETDDCFSDYKISKSGNGFKIMGNIHKDLSVLMERKGGEE